MTVDSNHPELPYIYIAYVHQSGQEGVISRPVVLVFLFFFFVMNVKALENRGLLGICGWKLEDLPNSDTTNFGNLTNNCSRKFDR
jgi:hypothetical protein